MEHNCFTDSTYVLDNMLLCARCYAQRALRVHGKEALFTNGQLVMIEYKDLSHLVTANGCDALEIRKKLYQEFADSKLTSDEKSI